MKIAICEDEKVFADDLKNRVFKFFEARGEKTEFSVFSDGTELISSLNGSIQYDIIFLDIQLENSNGMDIAARLRNTDSSVPIVFVTGLENKAADGYSVNAFDYIIKSTIEDKLDKVLSRFANCRSICTIAVESLKGGLTVIPLNDILYAESEGRHSVINTPYGGIDTMLPISRLSAMLPDSEFIEIHKSIYVRTAQIKSISSDTLELSDGKVLPLSRRRKKAVLSAVMRQVRNC